MKRVIILTVTIVVCCIQAFSQEITEKIIDLKFKFPSKTTSDNMRTIESLQKVKGTDGFYLLTYFGDYQEILWEENEYLIKNPLKNLERYKCSVFSTIGKNNYSLMGRNFDNPKVGSILVTYCNPPAAYSSIAFSIALNCGYKKGVQIETLSLDDRKGLLKAPFYPTDGMNECGVAVAVAGIGDVTIKSQKNKKLIFINHLVCQILDHAKNTAEAVKIAHKYVPFEMTPNSLNCHIQVTDTLGKSVVLEYCDDQWHEIYTGKNWQIMTNSLLYNRSEPERKSNCWRYKEITKHLQTTTGKIGWREAIDILKNVKLEGTTWSTVYNLDTKEIYVSVYQNWHTVYRIKFIETGK